MPEPAPRVACMATMEGREQQLAQAIKSLTPQVDRLYVYYNGRAGPRFGDYDVSKVHPLFGITPATKDRGDAGKFAVAWNRWVPADTFMFTVDDDLVYPSDYTKTLIDAWRFFTEGDGLIDRPMAVGVHAARFPGGVPPKSYRARDVRHCLHTCEGVRSEHMLGTGTLMFRLGDVEIRSEDFENGFMADCWFALIAQRQEIALRSIPRQEGWLKLAQPPPNDTLWRRMLHDGDKAQIEALGRVDKWQLH